MSLTAEKLNQIIAHLNDPEKNKLAPLELTTTTFALLTHQESAMLLENFQGLTDAIKTNKKPLNTLSFHGLSLSSEQIKLLTEACSENLVHDLNLNCCDLQDQDLYHIGEMLKKNNSIKWLRIAANSAISDTGINYLFEAIATTNNPKFKLHLFISDYGKFDLSIVEQLKTDLSKKGGELMLDPVYIPKKRTHFFQRNRTKSEPQPKSKDSVPSGSLMNRLFHHTKKADSTQESQRAHSKSLPLTTIDKQPAASEETLKVEIPKTVFFMV